ncbi:MAG: cobalamin-dependent protein [Bacteroidales bacterium]|nr:cobalamin-dependent protein [Bacteroidales bacterium]
MELSELSQEYLDAVNDTNREQARNSMKKALEAGYTPEQVVFDVILPSVHQLLEAYLKEEVVLTQHFLATKISEELVDELIQKFQLQTSTDIKVVIGCASGDFHGLGKKIVIGILKSNMIEAIDLGLNVSAEKFVDEAIKHHANIIGVSSMMMHTAIGENGPLKVREILQQRNLDKQIKLIVGGAPYQFDHELYKKVKADSWAKNGLEAISKIKTLFKEINYAH